MSENTPLPLHLKYRPQTLDEVVGNAATVKALETTLSRGAAPHSYLLTGPRGTGKTTIGRIIARFLGCTGRDFREMNSANYRGIDSVRELISISVLHPMEGDAVLYLLDEAGALTPPAQDALLKLLEEPPNHVYFVLATTEPEKLKDTIKSRCAHFVLAALPPEQIAKRLMYIVEAEECPVEYPTDKVISEIAKRCDGSMRQAVMMLDQVIDIQNEEEALEALTDAVGYDRQTIELCRALLKGSRWKVIRQLLQGINTDAETVRYSVLGYMNSVILSKEEASPQALRLMRHFLPSMMYTGRAGLTLVCFNVVEEHQATLPRSGSAV